MNIKKKTIFITSTFFMLIACDSKNNNPTPLQNDINVLECKVNDPDISKYYRGECKNGFAHGKGVAKDRDIYEGDFKNGISHGKGLYVWGVDSDWAHESYTGDFYNGRRTGFGELTVGHNSKNFSNFINQGVETEAGEVIKGIWDNGKYEKNCSSEDECFPPKKGMENIKEIDMVKALLLKKYGNHLFVLNELIEQMIPLDFSAPTLTNQIHACEKVSYGDAYIAIHNKVILDSSDLIEFLLMAMNEKVIYQIKSDCHIRVQKNGEDFLRNDTKYQLIDLNELRVSLEEVVGKRFRFQSNLIYMGNTLIAKNDPADVNFMVIDFEKLPRKQKIEIMNTCTKNVFLGCKSIVSGKVGNIEFQRAFIPDDIKIIE